MMASGANKKPDEVKVALLLHVLGEEAVEKYNTFTLTDEERIVYATVVTAFENYCVPRINESVERHIFFSTNQIDGESFDAFLTYLKKLCASCGFGDLKDSLIRDRIISGLNNKSLKDRLLREDALTLENCVKICKAAELATLQLKTLEEDHSVHGLSYNKGAQPKNTNGTSLKWQSGKKQADSGSRVPRNRNNTKR